MARPSRGFSESIGNWKCWFLRRGENRSTRRKTSRSKDENQQQTLKDRIREARTRVFVLYITRLLIILPDVIGKIFKTSRDFSYPIRIFHPSNNFMYSSQTCTEPVQICEEIVKNHATKHEEI